MRGISAACTGVLMLIAPVLSAQTPDSSIQHIELREVRVNTVTSGTQTSLPFHQSSGLASTEEILSRIEGVQLNRRGPMGMEPGLRGFSPGQITVALDGMQIFGACTDRMDPVSIYVEPINLEQIEIGQAGEGMALSNAPGGSIDFKLAEPRFDTPGPLSMQWTSGYYGSARAQAHAMAGNYREGNWAVRFSGTYRNAGNYKDGSGQQVDFSQYRKYNISTALIYRLSPGSEIKLDMLMDQSRDVGYPALTMDVGRAGAWIGSAAYHSRPENQWIQDLNVKLYLNTIAHHMDDTHRPDVAIPMDMPGWSRTQGGYVRLGFRPAGRHHVDLKIDAFHHFAKAEMTMYPPGGHPMYMLTWPESHRLQGGFFIQDRIHWNRDNQTRIKARLETFRSHVPGKTGQDQFSVLGYDIREPVWDVLKNIHLQHLYRFSGAWSISGSGGYGERAPNTSERFGFYLYNRMDNHDYIGNPHLKKERTLHGELTLRYTRADLSFKLAGFYDYILDYIQGVRDPALSTMTIGAEGVRKYENRAFARISGLETHLNYQLPGEHWVLDHTLSWVRGSSRNAVPLPLMAPLKSTLALRYHFSRGYVQAEHIGSLAQRRINAAYGEQATPGYQLLHLRAQFEMNRGHPEIRFGAGVENLLDQLYREHLDWGRVYRPGRNIYGNITVMF